MSEEVTDVMSLVQEAQSKSKFNLSEVIKGRGFPEDSVTIYLDVESAYKLTKLNDEITTELDPAKLEELEVQAKALSEEVMKSKLVFNMRGIPQALVEAIEKKSRVNKSDDEESFYVEYFSRLVAESIVSVEDSTGGIDDSKFTLEDVNDIRGYLPAEGWDQIVAATQRLTLASGYFKGLTDAGFLPKS
jgi:hypothetical protein